MITLNPTIQYNFHPVANRRASFAAGSDYEKLITVNGYDNVNCSSFFRRIGKNPNCNTFQNIIDCYKSFYKEHDCAKVLPEVHSIVRFLRYIKKHPRKKMD